MTSRHTEPALHTMRVCAHTRPELASCKPALLRGAGCVRVQAYISSTFGWYIRLTKPIEGDL